uniref:Phosphoglycerate mutase (2,3-diphosphoglycerate-dependent) n=1 Tax=Chromulina nebulosa TaxID=96789 RepID=A0A7S0SR39_9STRA|mmetsp:Transcript_2089/g.1868  ORF Transcript_2089/g.1868 Transcript_2089/m.1868 type:complete len:320 (+) Transcript_2089:54-1013(+)
MGNSSTKLKQINKSDTNNNNNDINILSPKSIDRRTKYSMNKLRLPKRIILVRHGESLGNVDELAYCSMPDWKIPLTEKGKEQASNVGKKIKEIIGNNSPISVYLSPYIRTKQTFALMIKELSNNNVITVREEPRLTEQQFGNFQKAEDMIRYKKERGQFGRFYYRFPDGESGLDVYSRVSSFIGTLFREWAKEQSTRSNHEDNNIIIVTHGLTLRLFLMRWFQFSVSEFENTRNPNNGDIIVMNRIKFDVNMNETLSDQSCIDTLLYSDHFILDNYVYEKLNIKHKTIVPLERSIVINDIERIVSEAEKGYEIASDINS